MKIIPRLIIKEWLRSFLASFNALFLIVTIVNLLNGLLRDSVSFKSVFFNYLIEVPMHLSKILPVSCLFGSLFSIAKLKNRNELTAIFASGFSIRSYVFNILITSMFIGSGLFFISMYVQPMLKKNKDLFIRDPEKFQNLKSKGLKSSTIGSGKIWFKSENYFFSFSSFNKKNLSLNNVSVYKFTPDSLLEKILTSEKISFNKEKKIWTSKITNEIYNLNSAGFPSFSEIMDSPMSITESSDDLKEIEADVTGLNLNDLVSYIRKLQDSKINTSEYEIIIYEALASGLSCIIFSLLALQNLFTPNRRSASFSSGLIYVFVFTIVYWLANTYFLELGINSKINAMGAAFLAPTIIGVYVIYNLVQKSKSIVG